MKIQLLALIIVLSVGTVSAADEFEVKWQYTVDGLNDLSFAYAYSTSVAGSMDYDGDGYPDLNMYISKTDQSYQTRIVSGATREPLFAPINTNGTTQASMAVDLDQDGSPEFILSNFNYNVDAKRYDGSIQVRSGVNGAIKWSLNVTSLGFPSVSFADFDRDGRPEFLFTTITANSVTVSVYGQKGEVGVKARGESLRPETMELRAFPNPFNSNSFIEFDVVRPGSVELSLFDTNGRMLAHRKLDNFAVGTVQVPLSSLAPVNLPSGAYFVDVSQDGAGTTRRIVKLP